MNAPELLRLQLLCKTRGMLRKCYSCGKVLAPGERYWKGEYKHKGHFPVVCACRDHETIFDSIDQSPELQAGLFFPTFKDYLETLKPDEVET